MGNTHSQLVRTFGTDYLGLCGRLQYLVARDFEDADCDGSEYAARIGAGNLHEYARCLSIQDKRATGLN